MDFSYDLIETRIIEVLPELKPAADVYIEREGPPGEDCGAYIFFEDMFGAYVEILLNMTESPGRNRLLKRAFDLVDEMLASQDKDVRDLAYIGILEWRGLDYYARALPFLGPVARRELDQWEPGWRGAYDLKAEVDPDEEMIDLFSVREVILKELRSEGIDRYHVPGNTYPMDNQGFASLEEAKRNKDAVVFLGCFSIPYVVCPPRMAKCSEATLLRLTQNLAEIENLEPGQKTKAYVIFPRIPLGERVWQMNRGDKQRLRYDGQLWINDKFNSEAFSRRIKDILDGKWEDL